MVKGGGKNTKKNESPPSLTEESEGEECSMVEMMKAMQAQLKGISTKLSKIDNIESEVRGLRVLLDDLKNENKQLKADARENEKKMEELNERNNQLENRLHSLEQHHRGWSARIMNIPLSPDDEANNLRVRDIVYNLALRPILEGAVEKNILQSVPTAEQLLETAHVLPGKPGQPKPVIMRFFNRNMRDIIFKLKKSYAPREETNRVGGASGGGRSEGGSGAGSGAGASARGEVDKGRFAYPIYEDLTKSTFQKMRAISNDERVKSCWTVKGQIRFTLVKNEKEVKKVVSLLEPLDSILK